MAHSESPTARTNEQFRLQGSLQAGPWQLRSGASDGFWAVMQLVEMQAAGFAPESFEVEDGDDGHLREPGSTAATMRWDSHGPARERSCIADTTSPRRTVRRAFVMKAGGAQQVSKP